MFRSPAVGGGMRGLATAGRGPAAGRPAAARTTLNGPPRAVWRVLLSNYLESLVRAEFCGNFVGERRLVSLRESPAGGASRCGHRGRPALAALPLGGLPRREPQEPQHDSAPFTLHRSSRHREELSRALSDRRRAVRPTGASTPRAQRAGPSLPSGPPPPRRCPVRRVLQTRPLTLPPAKMADLVVQPGGLSVGTGSSSPSSASGPSLQVRVLRCFYTTSLLLRTT